MPQPTAMDSRAVRSPAEILTNRKQAMLLRDLESLEATRRRALGGCVPPAAPMDRAITVEAPAVPRVGSC